MKLKTSLILALVLIMYIPVSRPVSAYVAKSWGYPAVGTKEYIDFDSDEETEVGTTYGAFSEPQSVSGIDHSFVLSKIKQLVDKSVDAIRDDGHEPIYVAYSIESCKQHGDHEICQVKGEFQFKALHSSLSVATIVAVATLISAVTGAIWYGFIAASIYRIVGVIENLPEEAQLLLFAVIAILVFIFILKRR